MPTNSDPSPDPADVVQDEQSMRKPIPAKDAPPATLASPIESDYVSTSDVEERTRTFLRRIWDIASAVADLKAESSSGTAFVNGVINRYGSEYVYSPIPRQGSVTTAEGFFGEISAIAVNVAAGIRKTASDPQALRDFLKGAVASTFLRLEREPRTKPEDLVDMLLSGIMVSPPKMLFAEARRFVARVRGYLETQQPDQKTPDYYGSLAALGDWITESKEPDSLAAGVFYYHEVLSTFVWHLRGLASVPGCPPRGLGNEGRLRIRNVANNTANYLDEINPGANDRRMREVMTQLKTVSTSMDAASHVAALLPVQQRLYASLLGLLLGQTGKPEPVWAPIWDHLMRTPTAWSEGRTLQQMAFLEAGAAPLRMVIPERAKDVSSALFNAGVSLLRHRRQLQGQDPKSVFTRTLLTGLGLWWSLKISNDNFVRAMVEFDGIECAVNFYASLTEVPLTPGERQNLDQLATSIVRRSEEIDELAPHVHRIRNSCQDIGLPLADSESNDVHRLLREVLAGVLGRLTVSFPLPPDDSDPQDCAEGTANIIRASFAQVFDKDGLVEAQDKVRELLQRLEKSCKDPEGTFLSVYQDWAADALGQAGTGPLVVAGLMTEQEWERVASESIDPDVTSLGRVILQEPFRWLG